QHTRTYTPTSNTHTHTHTHTHTPKSNTHTLTHTLFQYMCTVRISLPSKLATANSITVLDMVCVCVHVCIMICVWVPVRRGSGMITISSPSHSMSLDCYTNNRVTLPKQPNTLKMRSKCVYV